MDARPFPDDLQHFVIGEECRVIGTNVDFDESSEGRLCGEKLMRFCDTEPRQVNIRICRMGESMIPKCVKRFSEKIMLKKK